MLVQAFTDLVLTIIVEWAVVGLFLRGSKTAYALNLFLINLLTNPLAHLAVMRLGMPFWLVEGLVLFIEIGLFRLLLVRNWSQATLLASAANFASAILSFALYY